MGFNHLLDAFHAAGGSGAGGVGVGGGAGAASAASAAAAAAAMLPCCRNDHAGMASTGCCDAVPTAPLYILHRNIHHTAAAWLVMASNGAFRRTALGFRLRRPVQSGHPASYAGKG